MSTKSNSNVRQSRYGRGLYGPHAFGKFTFAIYPDYWKEKWGPKPMLGYVRADDKFEAERKAYDLGLLTVNFTFGPKAVKVYIPSTKPTRS